MDNSQYLRQIPYFAELNDEQCRCLIQSSHEVSLEEGEFLFHINEELSHFYLVLAGSFEIIFESQRLAMAYLVHDQPSHIQNELVVLDLVSRGEILGWSGLVPPHRATSGVRSRSKARLVAFNCEELLQCFKKDRSFGFLMIHTSAQVIGKRLQAIYKGV